MGRGPLVLVVLRILTLDHPSDLERELAAIGTDTECWPIFAQKHDCLAIKVEELSVAGANILKQTALGCGGDCAVNRAVVSGKVRRSDGVVFINRRTLRVFVKKLEEQPECASRLVPEFAELELNLAAGRFVRVRGKRFDLGSRSYVMGVLNVTPDSFSDGGEYLEPDAAVERARQMEEEGADFLDVGAESTRPGSDPVPDAEQVRRLQPVLKGLRRKVQVPVSVDTSSANVARVALDEGADMVNDVSGLTRDPKLGELVARAKVPCVVMHLPTRPKTMQDRPDYADLMAEVCDWLAGALERGQQHGIRREQMIVDPGIGFGKKLRHNLEILRRLKELESLGRPILVGPSRKSFIGHVLGLEPDERLEGTLAACVLAARNGANIVRVHDVKEAVRALRMADAIEGRA